MYGAHPRGRRGRGEFGGKDSGLVGFCGGEAGTAFSRWEFTEFAEFAFFSSRLVGESSVESLVALVSIDAVMSGILERRGDMLNLARIEEDRDESGILRVCLVDVVVDELAFPFDAEAGAGFFMQDNTAVIGLGTDHYDKVRITDMAVHPSNPAFGGRGFILVEYGVDALSPEAVREGEDAVGMVGGVVGVADEDGGACFVILVHIISIRYIFLRVASGRMRQSIARDPGHGRYDRGEERKNKEEKWEKIGNFVDKDGQRRY